MGEESKKYNSVDVLTRAIKGLSVVTKTNTLDSVDIFIRYYSVNEGFTEKGSNTAYFCKTCKGYYFGKAPLNKDGEGCCEVCGGLL